MNLTVLIDLDGTLLAQGFQPFQKAYLLGLSNHMGLAPGEMIPKLLAATDQMMQKKLPSGTLEETFDEHFYPAIGIPKADLQAKIEDFYAHVFPTFRSFTSPHPDARHVVEELFSQGATLALATNPLFPYTAIEQRLEWAGFPLKDYPFSLVPGFETFHFAKPNPAYFAELLGQLGCPNQPSVMLGDDLELDLLPSARMGIPGYWLNPGSASLPEQNHPLSTAGDLKSFPAWAREICQKLPEPPADTTSSLLPALKAAPAAMQSLAARLPTQKWNVRPVPHEWSLTEIFCHLRDVESEVNLPRIEQICQQENPFLPGIDTDAWAASRQYACQDGEQALQAYFQARTRLTTALDCLGDCCWERTARHAIFGPTRLFELATFMSTHDRSHIRQIFEQIPTRQGISI